MLPQTTADAKKLQQLTVVAKQHQLQLQAVVVKKLLLVVVADVSQFVACSANFVQVAVVAMLLQTTADAKKLQ